MVSYDPYQEERCRRDIYGKQNESGDRRIGVKDLAYEDVCGKADKPYRDAPYESRIVGALPAGLFVLHKYLRRIIMKNAVFSDVVAVVAGEHSAECIS